MAAPKGSVSEPNELSSSARSHSLIMTAAGISFRNLGPVSRRNPVVLGGAQFNPRREGGIEGSQPEASRLPGACLAGIGRFPHDPPAHPA